MLSTSRALHDSKPKGKSVCCIKFKKSYNNNLRKRENEEIVYSEMNLAARGQQQKYLDISTDGVTMGSPLSPGIANFFVEHFEKNAIEQMTHKPVCWFRYVGGTFVIWPHGQEKLTEFLNRLNGLHNKI